MFSLACNLLKLDACSNDFQNVEDLQPLILLKKIIIGVLIKNLYDCNQIISNQIEGSVKTMYHFHF